MINIAEDERLGGESLKSAVMPGDVSVLEVVTVVGRAVCAGAALTAALYLIRRVCLIMAWKSGGASHAELVNNLRSEFNLLRMFERAKADRFTVALRSGGFVYLSTLRESSRM